MSRDRKIGVLEALLERVRNRTGAPRVATAPAAAPEPVAALASEPPPEIIAAPIAGLGSEPPAAPYEPEAPQATPPEMEIIPPPPFDDGALSDSLEGDDDDDGPPSAPRLREGIVEAAADDEPDQDFPEDEVPIKTPPPESGRQHVAAVVSQSEDADELEAEIAITVTEESPSPPPAGVSEPPPVSSSVREPLPHVEIESRDGPMPRLAFVSEPEIELHVSRPPTAPSPPPSPSAPPPVEAKAPSAPPPPLPSAPPPVRLMAQPSADAGGPAPAPVEVWASTHVPSSLRAQVASFVGHNATFAPRSFGELLDASLGLGES